MSVNFSGISIQSELDSQRQTTVGLLVTPDAESQTAIGPNPFDIERRSLAAEAGRLQGQSCAAEVKDFWLAALPSSLAAAPGHAEHAQPWM